MYSHFYYLWLILYLMIQLLQSTKEKKKWFLFIFAFPGVEPFLPGPGWSLPGGKFQKNPAKINSGGEALVGGQFFDRPQCHKVAKVDKILFLFLCNITEIRILLKGQLEQALESCQICSWGGYWIENPSVYCCSEFMSSPGWKYPLRRSDDVPFIPGE